MPTANPIPPTLSDKEISRFQSLIDKSPGQGPKGDCWEWQGTIRNGGYGRISIGPRDNARYYIASRVSFFLATGIWSSVFICHHCDNPPCCNPDHLFEGDYRANAWDAKQKGRLATGGRAGAHKYPERISQGIRRAQHLRPKAAHRGENHRCAKLTEKDVRHIRRTYIPKYGWFSKIAREYNVSSKTIAMIVHREIWTHI